MCFEKRTGGAKPPTPSRKCSWCDGRGWVYVNFDLKRRECPSCNRTSCPNCKGRGRVARVNWPVAITTGLILGLLAVLIHARWSL